MVFCHSFPPIDWSMSVRMPFGETMAILCCSYAFTCLAGTKNVWHGKSLLKSGIICCSIAADSLLIGVM